MGVKYQSENTILQLAKILTKTGVFNWNIVTCDDSESSTSPACPVERKVALPDEQITFLYHSYRPTSDSRGIAVDKLGTVHFRL